MDHKAEFVAIIPVKMPMNPFMRGGPLELEGEPDTNESFITDKASREKYVADSFARALLWGSGTRPCRYHRTDIREIAFRTNRGTDISVQFEAIELLRLGINDGTHALAVLHGCLKESPSPLIDCLVELADVDPRHGAVVRSVLQNYLGPAFPIEETCRRARMIFLIETTGSPPVLDRDSSLSSEDQWLWYLATCQMPGRITIPAGAADQVKNARIPTSGRWSAAAFGDAVVYLTGPQGGEDSADQADFARRWLRFRTIDTDLVLLVEAQSRICASIQAELASMQTDVNARPNLPDSRRLLSSFRSTYWDDRILDRGPGVRLLALLHENRDLSRRVRDLRSRIEDLDRDVQSTLTSRTNAALGLLAVFGLPISVAMTAWSVGGSQDPWAGVLAVAAALGASAIILVIVPGLRSLIGDAYLLGRRRRK